MPGSPLVSIVMPVFNDEEWVAASLRSCLAQTLRDIEVICVDDASTDATAGIIARIAAEDSRVRLIRQPANRSAFQARREGVFAARAPYVLFVDGDDEILPETAQRTLALARSSRADVAAFGVEVVVPEGVSVGRFETASQPRHAELSGAEIAPALFPVDEVAQGHLWRYLWSVDLLRAAYEELPADLALYRANDLPISFLALARAHRYVSMPDRLYRYYWRRGVSGQRILDEAAFEFYLSALDSVDAIAEPVRRIGEGLADSAPLRATYASARRSTIQMILRYVQTIDDDDLRTSCVSRLMTRAGAGDVVVAAGIFFPAALPFLVPHAAPTRALDDTVRSVLLLTGNLASGGLQAVVSTQAAHLVEAGFTVTIAARTLDDHVQELPPGVRVVELHGASRGSKLASYLELLRESPFDVVIDHWPLYDESWVFYALAARAEGVPTVGWLHNFALRPIFDFSSRSSHLAEYLPLLARTIVLSPLDVAFWKLRGVDNAMYLPNPPSRLLSELPPRQQPRTAAHTPVRLVWWGRLQQHTKRVLSLVDVVSELRRSGVDFRLTIIGPDSNDLTAEDIVAHAHARGVADGVKAPGPLHGAELLRELEQADVFVSTSAIEGYQLTIVEAQALGLPVAMYELPWLATVQGNRGVVTAPQGDARALAQEIARLAGDPEHYRALSEASLAAARGTHAHDFTALYADLVTGRMAVTPSEPTLDDARSLLNLTITFTEAVIVRERGRSRALLDERNAEHRRANRLQARLDAIEAQREEPIPVRMMRPFGRIALRLFPHLRERARRFNRRIRGIEV